MSKIIVIGSGGHSGVVIDSWHRGGWMGNDIVGVLDDIVDKGQTRHGLPVLGPAMPESVPEDHLVIMAIGDNAVRFQVYARFPKTAKWGTIGDPDSFMATGAHLGLGSYMAHGAHMGCNSKTGIFCILNTKSILEHDCSVGNFTHIAPGAVIGGRVTIGSHVFIGIGAMVRDGVTIGDHATIGMGSVVVKDVPHNTVVVGNPARPIQTCA